MDVVAGLLSPIIPITMSAFLGSASLLNAWMIFALLPVILIVWAEGSGLGRLLLVVFFDGIAYYTLESYRWFSGPAFSPFVWSRTESCPGRGNAGSFFVAPLPSYFKSLGPSSPALPFFLPSGIPPNESEGPKDVDPP